MEWVRGEKLGHGSFATVSLAVPVRRDFPPALMAVKSCGVSHSSSLKAEKLILEELGDCPEIIRCFGDTFSCENGEILYNVLLEYASGGSLAGKMKTDRRLPEFEVRRYTKSLLKGLTHIHGLGYVHCDVKLQNILIAADGGARLADFGLARRGDGVVTSGCELRGTPMYMSPEMVAGGKQGAAADIWALGCAVAEMAGGNPAWSRFSDVAALMMKIGVGDQVPEIPGILSEEGKDFLKRCFVKDPRQRWTAAMLLNHPFIDDDSKEKTSASTSPRCPFGFSDWASSLSSTPSPEKSDLLFSGESQASFMSWLDGVICQRGPDWSDSGEWVTVR